MAETQNINVTKNTAFANMLGGYNGEKEYNKRNNPWTVASNNDGKNEINWSKARQTVGDLLADIAMFGVGALSGGIDDPIRGIGQGLSNIYSRHNAMNTAANNYIKEKNENELLDENARKYWDFLKTRDVQGLPKTREEVNRFTWGNHNLGDVVKDYQDQDSAYWTIQDKNNIVGFDNLGNTDITQPTNTTKPQPVQTPEPGVELKIQEAGEGEVLPNVQPVNYLQGGVVENESAYTPDKPFHPYNPSVVNNLLNNYTSERNNIRTNQTSRINNENTVRASMYGHNVSRQNALDRIAFDREKQAEMLDLQKQAQELNEMKNVQNQFNNAIKMYQNAVDNGDKETANFYLQQANELSYYYPELSLGVGNGMPSIPVQKNVPVQVHSTNAF